MANELIVDLSQNEPAVMDTYACLLFKNGNKVNWIIKVFVLKTFDKSCEFC